MLPSMRTTVIFAVTGSLLVGHLGLAHASGYNFSIVESVGGDVVTNNSGSVAGALAADGYGAGIWTGSSTVRLTGLGGYFDEVNGLNDAGQATGFSFLPGNSRYHATRWSGGAVTDLGTLGGDPNAISVGYSINSAGHVVGLSGVNFFRPVVWTGDTAVALPALEGASGNGNAFSINDSDQIVGTLQTANGRYHAVKWSAGQTVDLGTSFEGTSLAVAINNAGQIVGSAQYQVGSNWYSQPVMWINGVAHLLGMPPGYQGAATAVNDAGLVVGSSYGMGLPTRAMIWENGNAVDLNTFLNADAIDAGWVLEAGNDVNDQGVIVGEATNTKTGLHSTFMLSPVPEPSEISMVGAGLLLATGAGVRRRRARMNQSASI